jgi:hypothetical protein
LRKSRAAAELEGPDEMAAESAAIDAFTAHDPSVFGSPGRACTPVGTRGGLAVERDCVARGWCVLQTAEVQSPSLSIGEPHALQRGLAPPCKPLLLRGRGIAMGRRAASSLRAVVIAVVSELSGERDASPSNNRSRVTSCEGVPAMVVP